MTVRQRSRAGRRSLWSPLGPILVVCLVAAACGGADSGAKRAGQETAEQAARDGSASDSLARLIHSLASLRGRFSRTGIGFAWEFEGDMHLFHAIADFGDSAVARLVSCLTDTTKAVATVEGRTVLVGVMCYEALRRVAYFEWDPDDYRDAPSHRWPGSMDPTADPQQLRTAHDAWAEIVRRGLYILS
jgi:hypothetical protein